MAISNEKMANAIIASDNIKQASEILQCNESTIYRRLSDINFRDLIRKSRVEIISNTNNKISKAQEIGLDRLIKILQDDNMPPDIGIKAYREIRNTQLNRNLTLIESIKKTEDNLYGDYFSRLCED